MTKRTFTPVEWFHLTELAQAAVVAGLIGARRWAPGQLKFQGGTSLHLVYGSPRFSEDLDFVTATPKGLQAAVRAASSYAKAALAREFPALHVALKVRDQEGIPAPRNPRLFTLTLSEPDWYESLKVKVEFYIVPEAVSHGYVSANQTIIPLRPRLRVDLPNVMIETAALEEILCDKIHALGDRARIKERDIFDLWWICNQQGSTSKDVAKAFGQRHTIHMAMYPNGKPLAQLAHALRDRAAHLSGILLDKKQFERMVDAISRWLPTANVGPSKANQPNLLASQPHVRAMVEHAVQCAVDTAEVVEQLVRDGRVGWSDEVGPPP